MAGLKIISNAKQKFSELTPYIQHTENVLQYYDNVTYNIRFYMLPILTQQILSQNRIYNKLANFSIDDKDKIIIAESGKSSKINIESLTLKTIYANMTNSNAATTFGLELKLSEVYGCQLLNQITTISKLLGYPNYICQPFHLDIWFSGYNNETHKPENIIKEIGVLTYEFIANDVKTDVSDRAVSYTISGVNSGIGSLPKEATSMSDLGQFKLEGSKDLVDFKNVLEKRINEEYFKVNPQFKPYYNDGKYINIRLIDTEDKRASNPINMSDNYVSESLYNATFLPDLNKENESDKNETDTIKPDQKYTLMNIFQEFALKTSKLSSYIVRPMFKTITLKNAEGMQHYKHYVDVLFTKNVKLEADKDRFMETNSKHTQKELQDYDYSVAYNYLRQLLTSKLINKKYEWLFNGKNTEILELQTSIDKLWFSNIPRWDIQESSDNDLRLWSNDKTEMRAIEQATNLFANNKKTMDVLKEEVRKLIENTTVQYNALREATGDKRLYMEDIYACIDSKLKKKLLGGRAVLEKVDINSGDYPNQDMGANTESIASKAAYSNFYSQNLVQLKFKIFGDPYWLALSSDSVLYGNSYGDIGNLQHFVFKMKTSPEQKEDGTLDLENVVDFTNIFQMIQSTSFFEGGVFTQVMEGMISPTFLPLGRLEI